MKELRHIVQPNQSSYAPWVSWSRPQPLQSVSEARQELTSSIMSASLAFCFVTSSMMTAASAFCFVFSLTTCHGRSNCRHAREEYRVCHTFSMSSATAKQWAQ